MNGDKPEDVLTSVLWALFDLGKLRVPGRGTGVRDTAERCLHLRVDPLQLSVGLGVVPGGKAGCRPLLPSDVGRPVTKYRAM